MKKNTVVQSLPWLKTWLFFFGAIIILAFLGLKFYQTWQQSRVVKAEIESLADQVDQLDQDKIELSELIDYLNSMAYVEKKARLDLGLKKTGEKAVIIPDLIQPTDPLQSTAEKNPKNTSNLGKWWHYFFGVR